MNPEAMPKNIGLELVSACLGSGVRRAAELLGQRESHICIGVSKFARRADSMSRIAYTVLKSARWARPAEDDPAVNGPIPAVPYV